MKCDELKQYEVFVSNPYNTGGSFREIAVLPADKVAAAIEELKDIIADLQKTNVMLADNDVKLNRKLENVQASMYADVVDANMKIRRLKRALYKACANWALSTLAWLDCVDQGEPRKWSEMRQKCLKKAEEYKL